ncbi:MAG: hypothetical protein VX367_09785 [SAR324 cluster bacterium]|nr:hypothetical protein [SAR324 cluster bacterium]
MGRGGNARFSTFQLDHLYRPSETDQPTNQSTDRPTNQPTNRRTKPLIELRVCN